MKATGIVRRIDDLGRVVIPKEIRRTLKIREGDPLEIFIEDNDCICFKRYSVLGSLTEEALRTAITMASNSGLRPIAIYDTTVKLRGMENFPPYVSTSGILKESRLFSITLMAFTRFMRTATLWVMRFATSRTWVAKWT